MQPIILRPKLAKKAYIVCKRSRSILQRAHIYHTSLIEVLVTSAVVVRLFLKCIFDTMFTDCLISPFNASFIGSLFLADTYGLEMTACVHVDSNHRLRYANLVRSLTFLQLGHVR